MGLLCLSDESLWTQLLEAEKIEKRYIVVSKGISYMQQNPECRCSVISNDLLLAGSQLICRLLMLYYVFGESLSMSWWILVKISIFEMVFYIRYMVWVHDGLLHFFVYLEIWQDSQVMLQILNQTLTFQVNSSSKANLPPSSWVRCLNLANEVQQHSHFSMTCYIIAFLSLGICKIAMLHFYYDLLLTTL